MPKLYGWSDALPCFHPAHDRSSFPAAVFSFCSLFHGVTTSHDDVLAPERCHRMSAEQKKYVERFGSTLQQPLDL